MARPEPWCHWQGSTLVIGGELNHLEADAFVAEVMTLTALPAAVYIDLQGFDIADGIAAVAAVNALRWLARGRHLVVHAAPQLLAHNLYRVGDLEGTAVVLVATREDEPYG